MDDAISEYVELKKMREHVRQSVNSLEVCWSCERVCECEQWLLNKAVPIWLCLECLAQVRVENLSRPPLPEETAERVEGSSEHTPGNPQD